MEEEYIRSKKELQRQKKEAVAESSTKRSDSENGEDYRVGGLSDCFWLQNLIAI